MARNPNPHFRLRESDLLRRADPLVLIPQPLAQERDKKKVAYCKVCKANETFTFIGSQQFQKQRIYDYYDCSGCGDTRTFNHTKWWRILQSGGY